MEATPHFPGLYIGFLLKHFYLQVEISPRLTACVDGEAVCPALLQAPWSRRIYSNHLCLFFLLAPSVELLLSIQIASVTSWGSLHVPCKQHRERILPCVCYPGTGHRESGGCLSHVPEAFRGFGSFLPTLSQLCFFHKHKHRIHTVTLVVLLKFYFEFEKCCLKTCIQLEHHLDGTGQRDSSASKKSLREKKKKIIIQILMCNYSVKQQNPISASFFAALCFGPGDILFPGGLRESVPGQAREARHGG